MNYSWKTSCPTKNSISESKPFIIQGNEWKMMVINKHNKIYITLEYLGNSYFDIFTEYEIVINDKRSVKGNFQFSQIYRDFGFYIDEEEEYHIGLKINVMSGHYDSREITGYVGLRNLGATCYINSFIQTIFNIKKFRADILNCEPVDKILLLQRLFYKMQIDEDPLDTTEFVVSNVWDDDIHLHQDIHEFSKVFFDTVEKESKKKEIIEDLIQGQVTNYIKASCGCTRNIKENFQDIQVEIRDFFNQKLASNLDDSFKKYTKPEILDGNNKYNCEKHGLVEAEKGVMFSDLPPVLFILLKRFNMDFETGEGYKINDYFEFPDILDMKPYCENKDDCDKKTIYKLYSIVVHKGGPDEGHFYVYICINDQWFKFNDTVVSKVSKEEAMYMNFGGKHPYKKKTKEYSAYYLVYLNKNKIPDLLYTDVQIPEEVLKAIVKRDQKVPVKMVSQEDIRNYNGPGFCNLNSFDYSLTGYREVNLTPGDDVRVFKNKVGAILNTRVKIFIFEIIKKHEIESMVGNYVKRPKEDPKSSYICRNELVYVDQGVVNLKSSYFVYKSFKDINFSKCKLLFIKVFRGDVWCKDTIPTNLSMIFAMHMHGTLEENLNSLKEKTGIYNAVVYRERGQLRLSPDTKIDEMRHGDILIILESENEEQFLDFTNELLNRMCINVIFRENSFTMFIPRKMDYSMIEKKIREFVSDESVVVLDNEEADDSFKTANEDSVVNESLRNISNCGLDKNSLAIEMASDRKLIYLGQSLTHIDYNAIQHVHPFAVLENSTVEDLVKKVLVSPFKCFSGVQEHGLQDIRVVDTIKGMLYLKSYKLTEKFTSQGMNVIQTFTDKRYIKGAYYSGMYKILGYPFYIFTDSTTVYEFREKFRISQKLIMYDGSEYLELDAEDRLTNFSDETYLLIEMR
ncbi:Ubiquitin carboxyl-terminal hydrolase 7 [Nosema granulosis]|uniref:Ubiquitin carboxyl-terminal hydrolase n=1 Tax=Nosema granulosis TaxID=83296 RepID=A0A9P6GZY6_9MICR|nr:Ubiquitin carboxyl-terminal hydrolase 7 [Nosema granulosis]